MLAGLWWVPESGFKWVNDLHHPPNFRLPLEERGESRGGPWLVTAAPQEQTWIRRYPVLKRSKLLGDFYSLSLSPSPDAILKFANRWGWLGEQDAMFRPTGRVVGAEPLHKWVKALLEFRHPYEAWQAVETIDFEHAQSADQVGRARRLLASRVSWTEDLQGVRYNAEITFSPDSLPFAYMPLSARSEWIEPPRRPGEDGLLARWRPKDTVEPARYYVYKTVNAFMEGKVNLAVLPFLDRQMHFFPRNLLAAVYVHFAFSLVGAGPQQRTCEFCREPFPMRRRDQRFCGKNCREAAGYHRRKTNVVGAAGVNRR